MESSSTETEPDLYGILNVPSTASNEEIQKAYKTLSKTFHPDRLRARHAEAAELAQETFVRIKTAHDVLCDRAYKFAYDQYGHEGVQFLRHCQQQKEGQKANKVAQQQLLLPLDVHLYSKLQKALSSNSDIHLSMAVRMFRDAMERYRRQTQQIKQRIRDSAFSFDATVEFPCAYYPSGGAAANEKDWFPYLELEQSHMEFNLRSSNRRPVQQAQSSSTDNKGQQQVPQVQKHIYTTSVGTKTEWEATGKSNAEVSFGVDYQTDPTSKTQWSCEMSTPVTKIPEQQSEPSSRRPVKLSLSTTHEFLSGTATVVGVRGSNVSRKSWEYFITSFRKLSIGRLQINKSNAYGTAALHPNIRASFAMGMGIVQQKPLYAFVALNSIPPPKEQQQQQHQRQEEQQQRKRTFSSLFPLSTPEVQVRAGYHPTPLHASIKYKEFLLPWLSLFASWSWSFTHDCSKIKILLTADYWGLFQDNDSTTLRTGIRHDLVSGWIWLFEWEESEWTLKIPVSLSITKNTPWIAPAMGIVTSQTDMMHQSMAAILASYISIKVARSILSDWQGESMSDATRRKQSTRASDATRGDHDKGQDSFGLDPNEDEKEEDGMSKDYRREQDTFRSFMISVAKKKREVEQQNDGLVLRFARIVNAQMAVAAWDEGDLESFQLDSPALMEDDITNILQFWVSNGKLDLPPLESQSRPYCYAFGEEPDTRVASLWPLNFFELSKAWKRKIRELTEFITKITRTSRRSQNIQQNRPSFIVVIRYEHRSHVYEVSIGGDERIKLPNPKALFMGNAGRVA